MKSLIIASLAFNFLQKCVSLAIVNPQLSSFLHCFCQDGHVVCPITSGETLLRNLSIEPTTDEMWLNIIITAGLMVACYIIAWIILEVKAKKYRE